MSNFDSLGGLSFSQPLGQSKAEDDAKAKTDKATPLQAKKGGTSTTHIHTQAEADYARIHAYKATTIITGLGKVTNSDDGFVQNGKKVNLSTLMMLMLQRVHRWLQR